MTAWADLSRSRSARVKALDAWWQSCAGDSLPDRADFDPSTFTPLLPFLLLSEVEQPFRLRYRLIGTAVRDVAGSNFAGRYLDEILPNSAEEEPWLDHYHTAYETARPLYGSCRIRTLSGGHTEYEFGIWPLGHRQGAHQDVAPIGAEAVRQFIGLEDYGDWRGRVRPLRDELADWQYALQAGAGATAPRLPR
ncbi:PAS domain-containing protein [Dongia rigui]|uniref:PAS domain-containing protein n=1 Tax=Dongia rigui TaxID=940149 RepID=A0ABU5DYV1_9PROT|nr:PAS domain-containing protein [Dongia rigui]MDY0872197.1 PAS domain-containing protein [Dongia rigui]